jgi:non-homologous end joining protein Ku
VGYRRINKRTGKEIEQGNIVRGVKQKAATT